MKLQAGKTYRRRDGGLESIVRVDEEIAFNADDDWWNIDGSSLAWKESPEDLISEVSNEPFYETSEHGLSVVRSNANQSTEIPHIIDEPRKAGCAEGLETIGFFAGEISRLRSELAKSISEVEAVSSDLEFRRSLYTILSKRCDEMADQRDEYKLALQSADSHNTKLTTDLEIAREQRDRLVEALERILEYQGQFGDDDPQGIAADALSELKGASHE